MRCFSASRGVSVGDKNQKRQTFLGRAIQYSKSIPKVLDRGVI